MNTYYVCSRYRGTNKQMVEHIKYAKELTKEVLLNGDSAITPHLYITNCLDDSDPKERCLGLSSAIALLQKCDAVIIGQRFGISEGMAAEIKEAEKCGIPVIYWDNTDKGML